MQTCPKCSTSIIDTNKECNNCGMSLEQVICSNCSAILDIEADLCDSCGYFLNREFFIVTDANIYIDQLLNDRYRVLDVEEKIVKDTTPNTQTFYSSPIKNNDIINLYRKLGKYNAVSKIHDSFSFEDNDFIVLYQIKDSYGQNYRTIKEGWVDSTDREKLQLMRDWANLYKILENDNVITSLFDTYNLFVDEDLNLKIKSLKIENDTDVNLKKLGNLWTSLIFTSGTSYLEYSKFKAGDIVRQLIEGKLDNADELIKRLDDLLDNPISDIEHFASTNVGKRRNNNEDNFYAATIDFREHGINRTYNGKRGLYIVCDGMGGHESGELASASAVSSIRTTILPALPFSLNYEDIKKLLEEAIINQANESIFQVNESQSRQLEKRMGTTVVAAIAMDNKIYSAHVGDSRMYLITQNTFEQITEDHNVAMKNYRDGVGTLEDAINNTSTHWGKVLTQALGPKGSEFIYPEINTFILKEDSYLVLCSDGLTDMVKDEQIETIVRENWEEPKKVVNTLIETANNNGGRDNVSVVASKIRLMPPLFPPVDYADIFYSDEADVNTNITEISEIHEESLDGIIVDPEEKSDDLLS